MRSALEDRRVPLLEARGLTKIFGTLRACDHIDLKIGRGEIHALLGENGAGKSTLVKMLFGALEPTEGSILWKGEQVAVSSPREARRIGIGMVFQHFCLFDALTASENILVSLDDPAPAGAVTARARDISKAYGLPVDPNAHVGDLSVGERQRIEIIRCLLQNPELIILDEPTSVLTPQEADRLFEALEKLKEEGRSILYISHRLEEVKRICDRATVLRQGKVVSECDPRKETASSLARMMVGNEVQPVVRDKPAVQSEALLEVRDLDRKAGHPFAVALSGINLSVRAGEILGVAGVAGNGQGELFEAVSGEALQERADQVRIRGKDAGRRDISERRLMGAAFVPEERLGHAAAPAMTLSQNLLLSRYRTDARAFLNRLGMIRNSLIAHAAQRVSSAMDVRKGVEDPEASALSGGNLQKFVIGRELDRQPLVMVVNQPTWGVDAGAAARIRQALIDLAKSGSAVLVISQDLDELFEICDAIAVMHGGRLSAPIPIGDATYEKIGLLMGGAEPGHAAVSQAEAV
ncbi:MULTISPECIES: ATP-binding cassette domain-containing protein [Chelativorans]|uniref:Nucleoside ABC transporter ATP-binding protein n=1 Tax=Chelativorans sp. (strain BNC1) TaxID=266779 RepID=Q11HN7_CHESB